MAAAYLVSTGLTPKEAWAKIRERRPFIRPQASQVSQVARLADALQRERDAQEGTGSRCRDG
jgi:hypothetical protein